MFDLRYDEDEGTRTLFYTERYRYPGERGMWVEIAHENDKEAQRFIDLNRKMGLQVEKDYKGFYRVLVLKD